jgi:hypothetical protein
MLRQRVTDVALAGLGWLVCLLFVVGLRPLPRLTLPPEAQRHEPTLIVDVAGLTESGACAGQPDAGPCAARSVVPLSNARVRVLVEQDGFQRELWDTRADAQGRATLSVPPGTLYVLADAEGWARRSLRLELGEADARAGLELARAEPFEVRVVSEAGMPIVEANVVVTTADELPHVALTNREGVASFARLAPPLERVAVSASGFAAIEVAPVLPSTEVLMRAPSRLEVLLQDETGRALSGAELWIAGLSIWPPRKVTSDDSGMVQVDALEPGIYDLKAQHEGRVSRLELGLSIERSELRRMSLELAPGRWISARVTDGEGALAAPLAGAEVVLVEGGLSPFPLAGRTDAEGKVRLGPVRAGSAVLNVSAERFVPRTLVKVPSQGDAEVPVALLRGGRLRGSVKDQRGRAIEGARIEVIGNDSFGNPLVVRSSSGAAGRGFFERVLAEPVPLSPGGELGVTRGPLPVPGGSLGAFMPAGLPGAPSWTSRSDGEFVIEDVPPGSLRVLVTHPDYVEAQSELTDLGSGGEARLDLVLAQGASVEGRVVDPLGRPVPRARIDVVAARTSLHKSVHSDGAGRFALRALPSDVVLELARPGHGSEAVLRQRLSLGASEQRTLELVLPEERGRLSLTVTDAGGAPLSSAQVTLLSLEPDVQLRRTLFSDVRGRVEQGDVQGLALKVSVELPGFRPVEVMLDETPAELTLMLSKGLTVIGRVTHLRGRLPVDRASVTLTQGGVRRETKSDDTGEYRLSDLAAGSARLRIAHPDHAPEERNVVLTASELDVPFELPDIDLGDAGGIAGVVLDRDGRPVRGARVGVGVVPAFLPAGPMPAGLVQTDANGQFRLLGIAEGLVRVSAYATGVGRGSVDGVEVTEGHVIDGIEIRLAGDRREAASSALGNVAVTLGERREDETLVVIVHVAERSEAERAGLVAGDVLLSVDDVPVDSMQLARDSLAGPEGSDVLLELLHDGRTRMIRVRRERVRH